MIEFSGYQWLVKQSDERQGPGPNSFSPENAWVDAQGLHLKVTKRNDRWYCAEVFLEKPLGYGTYEFAVKGRFDQLDPQVIGGLFLYRDDTHELDIEFGRWGKPDGDNLQYVLQPYDVPGNEYQYKVKLKGDNTSHSIAWQENSIAFRSAEETALMTQWTFGKAYHTPTTERVHMNLWLFRGLPPLLGKEAEIIITHFAFRQEEGRA